MRVVRLGQNLTVAVALSLTLLIIGVAGLGVGIQHGAVVPPDLDISLSGIHIIAYTTDPHECRIALPCPGPKRDTYVVLVFRKAAPDDVGLNGGRILVVPSRR